MIKKNDKGQFCLYSEDGENVLGCYDTEAEAQAQEVAAKEQETKEAAEGLTVEQVGAICPPCAKAMQARGLSALKPEGMEEDALRTLLDRACADGGDPGLCERLSKAVSKDRYIVFQSGMWCVLSSNKRYILSKHRTVESAREWKKARRLEQFRGLAEGDARTEQFHGKPHIVVPVVALVEGVVQASNAGSPELVMADEFGKMPQAWDGRPVMLNHPAAEDGARTTANTPATLDKFGIGYVFNAAVKDKKLTMEAWLDPDQIVKAGGEELLGRIANQEEVEVSVGVYVNADTSIVGEYEGAAYNGKWTEIVPDHLAFLPAGLKGACSNKMGCGVRAAASGEQKDEPPVRDEDVRAEQTLKTAAVQAADAAEQKSSVAANNQTSRKGVSRMKKDLVAKILAAKGSPYAETDAAVLEQLSEERLAAIVASLEPKPEPTPEELREKTLAACPDIKAVLDEHKERVAARRAELLTALKEQDVYTEDELKAMDLPGLEKVGRLAAKVSEKKVVDFSGRAAGAGKETNDVPAPPSLVERINAARAVR